MNSAQRILNVITAIREHKQSPDQCLPAWTELCGKLYGDDKGVDQHRITAIFAALNEEADFLNEELEEKNLPRKIYVPYLNEFRSVLQPVSLPGAWSNCVKKITPNTENVFQWIALYLGEQEEPISQNDLNELLESLRGIDALIAEPGLPRSLKRIIKNNADAIWDAIDVYPIHGAASLGEAIKRAAGDLTFSQTEIESALESDSETARKATSQLLSVIKNTVTVFNASVKTAENLLTLSNAVSTFLKLH